jgi:putative secretion ATPase (PEP-CTERM system associated)
MYEAFYGFKERPFSLLPDPSFLYLGKKHSLALSMLEYGLMNQAGFTVITGEVGSGKTTLIRHLLSQIGDDITVGLINNTPQDIGQLLQWVMLSFGQEYRDESRVVLFDAFTQFLIEQYANNKRSVLIIDEAQNLDPVVLEELRMLSNINADKDQLLQLILVGQPELRDKLRSPELLQFIQRVLVDYHLTALDKAETRDYILYRTRQGGCETEIFDAAACDLVYRASQGVPRVINVLCDTALVYGFADQQHTVDVELVRSVLKDKASTGLFRLHHKGEPEKKPVAVDAPEEVSAVKLEPVPLVKAEPGPPHEQPEVVKQKIRPVARLKKEEAKQLFRKWKE